MAELINRAQTRVCYVAPGIQDTVAEALSWSFAANPGLRTTVSVDFSEGVFRMGYGSLQAIEKLQKNGIGVVNSPGLRAAVLIVDDAGWVFTPTALYLEPEPQSEETPNAIRLTQEQIEAVVLRISPKEKEAAVLEAASEDARQELESIIPEIGNEPVTQTEFEIVKGRLEQVPPVKFDVARQVRVFEPYFQYVEINLRGAAIQRKRIRIPRALVHLGSSEDLEGRLRMTFDLIERDSQVSSKQLEKELDQLRHDFTESLGRFGRVMLKAARRHFDKRIDEFRARLTAHKEAVQRSIEEKLKKSRDEVIEYYLPTAKSNPPDELIGRSLNPKNLSNKVLRKWIGDKLDQVFPSPEETVSEMSLDVSFKDVTFETLNDPEFIDRLKRAYPEIDWEKPYSDFIAMGEDKNAA